MDRKIRPSGLTAFAIFNFVFAGLSALGVLLGLAAQLACVSMARKGDTAGPAPELLAVRLVFIALSLGVIALLVVSGIGYLKVNRKAGRWCGNLYALLQIAAVVVRLALTPLTKEQVNLFMMIDIVWPILTLFFINLVFRDVWKKHSPLTAAPAEPQSAAREDEPPQKNPPHTVLIMLQSVRQTLRGVQGILFIWLALFVCFVTAQVILVPLEFSLMQTRANEKIDQAALDVFKKEFVRQVAYQFFVWHLDEPKPEQPMDEAPAPLSRIRPEQEKSAWADYLTKEKPAYLSFIFAVLAVIFPILSAFLVFNQISDDAKRKGFRYLLLRTTRSAIYFGKLLASLVILVPVILFSVAAIAAYVHAKFSYYPVEDIVSWSLWAVAALSLVCVPAAALCLAFSALINSSFGSLAAGALTLGLYPLFTRLLKDAAQFLGFLQFLLPIKAATFLYHPQGWAVLLAALACLAYAGVFTAGGFISFKRKSL